MSQKITTNSNAYGKLSTGGAGSSLAIIEDCLDQLYRARRNSLSHRARKFREKHQRDGLEKDENDDPKQLGKKGRRNRSKFVLNFDEQEEDEPPEDLALKELAVKFHAPPPKAKPLDVSAARMVCAEFSQESTAEELLIEFCKELKQMFTLSDLLWDDEDYRAEQSDALIDKYFLNNLDKLEPTPRIAEIKKIIAHIIEEFSATGKIKELVNSTLEEALLKNGKEEEISAMNKMRDKDEKQLHASSSIDNDGGSTKKKVSFDPDVKKSNNKSNSEVSKQLPEPARAATGIKGGLKKIVSERTDSSQNENHGTDRASNNSSAGGSKARNSKDVEERQKWERQRIKEQYESLMSLKKKTDQDPDAVAYQQHSALHSDIQSVISAIQQNKSIK